MKQARLGALCSAVTVAMYASPLAVLKKALQTRSNKGISLAFAFLGTTNSMFWSGYGFLRHDPWVSQSGGRMDTVACEFPSPQCDVVGRWRWACHPGQVLTPNLLGAGCSILQLGLYYYLQDTVQSNTDYDYEKVSRSGSGTKPLRSPTPVQA